MRLEADHYIRQMSRALARIFNLLGPDVDTWVKECKAIRHIGRSTLTVESSQAALDMLQTAEKSGSKAKAKQARQRITDHFVSMRCHTCSRETRNEDRASRSRAFTSSLLDELHRHLRRLPCPTGRDDARYRYGQ